MEFPDPATLALTASGPTHPQSGAVGLKLEGKIIYDCPKVNSPRNRHAEGNGRGHGFRWNALP